MNTPTTDADDNELAMNVARDRAATRGDWLQTFTMRQVYPLDLRPEDVAVEDIAHALSLQCRFAGHTRGLYSVGQHSLLVADYLRDLSEQDLAESRKALDKAGARHDMVIRTGNVGAEIAAAAAEGKFDLILMGSKGRSALKDLLMGSVAQRVMEFAKTPVLMVK